MIGYAGLGDGSQEVAVVGTAVGAGIAKAAPLAGPAAPIVLAIGGFVALASNFLAALGIGGGCGQSCVQATQIVNQAEPLLKQNLAAFQSGQIDKQTGISNFNQVWNAVQQACGAIHGDAGKNCIGDRQRGGKWDWFAYYYDPIANAPDNVQTMNSLVGGSGLVPLLIGGGLIVAGVML